MVSTVQLGPSAKAGRHWKQKANSTLIYEVRTSHPFESMSTFNDYTDGVFKIPIQDEVLYYYVKSSLVCIRNKLYVPFDFGNIYSSEFLHAVMLSIYRDGQEISLSYFSQTDLGPHKCVAGFRERDGPREALFKQNHLIDYFNEGPPVMRRSAWGRIVLNQDQIMPRVVRVQRLMRFAVRKKRLYRLAIVAKGNNVLTADVLSLIAGYLWKRRCACAFACVWRTWRVVWLGEMILRSAGRVHHFYFVPVPQTRAATQHGMFKHDVCQWWHW
jgi:hypothetical protein